MFNTAEKVRENRLRRMASRQGFILRKSRVRDPWAIDYGVFYLIEANRNYIMCQSADIDVVEGWLVKEPA